MTSGQSDSKTSHGPIVTLTTDFGTADGYVGAMKGVILTLCPGARLVDLTHDIAPQDVAAAAEALRAAVPLFPPGTVHLAVIDPGVGGARRGVAAHSPDWILVGPDNGLFDPLFRMARRRHGAERLALVELAEPRFFRPQVSSTFHGRDVFAPVAAHLARGLALAELGPPIDDPRPLELPEPVRQADGSWQGRVIHVDRFGNCITNLEAELLARLGPPERLRIRAAGRDFGPLRRTYSEVEPGEPLALADSAGRLELALREGSLAEAAGLEKGTTVQVELA